jgi:hypothetical protein
MAHLVQRLRQEVKRNIKKKNYWRYLEPPFDQSRDKIYNDVECEVQLRLTWRYGIAYGVPRHPKIADGGMARNSGWRKFEI